MRCRFSPLAELDLEEIDDYIVGDNQRRAISFIEELSKGFGHSLPHCTRKLL